MLFEERTDVRLALERSGEIGVFPQAINEVASLLDVQVEGASTARVTIAGMHFFSSETVDDNSEPSTSDRLSVIPEPLTEVLAYVATCSPVEGFAEGALRLLADQNISLAGKRSNEILEDLAANSKHEELCLEALETLYASDAKAVLARSREILDRRDLAQRLLDLAEKIASSSVSEIEEAQFHLRHPDTRSSYLPEYAQFGELLANAIFEDETEGQLKALGSVYDFSEVDHMASVCGIAICTNISSPELRAGALKLLFRLEPTFAREVAHSMRQDPSPLVITVVNQFANETPTGN